MICSSIARVTIAPCKGFGTSSVRLVSCGSGAWRELGKGAPVVLIHGLFSNAATNWLRYGHAAAIAAAGFRVVMPDLRAHGASGAPHDRAAYPPDILADDARALVAHLGLGSVDLGGYSLGARTAVRLLVGGLPVRRVVLAGMGLDGLLDTGRRAGHFRRILANPGSFERGSPEWLAEAFLKYLFRAVLEGVVTRNPSKSG